MNEQNKIRVEIDGNVDGLRRATTEADADLARLRNSASSTGSSLSGLQLAAEGTGVAIGGMATAAGIAATAWVGYQGAQVAAAILIKDTADELGKLSQRLGVSVESLSGLRYAAALSDVSLSELTGGLKNLANRAQDNAPAFKAMGIAVRDAEGTLKPLDGLLAEVADKFAGYNDGAAKTALANDVFGRSGEKLIPLLNQGAAGLREQADEAKKLGAIYGDDLAKKSEVFNDNLTRLKAAAEGLTIELGSGMLPVLAQLSEELVQATKASGGFFAGLHAWATSNPFKSYGDSLKTIRAELEALEAGDVHGFRDEKAIDLKKRQIEYLKEMQRAEALKLGDGAYSNEGRGVGTGKTEAPVPEKKGRKDGVGRADPLDGLLENYRRDALAQEVGLAPATVKEIENLGELIARGKIDVAEYDRLLGAVLDKDSVLKKEQGDLDAARKKSEADQKKAKDLIADYERGNATLLERIRRESELALMTEKQRAVAEALYRVEDDRQKLRERIIRDIADETARTEALAAADAMLAEQKEKVAAATEKSIEQQRSFEFGWGKALNSYVDDAENAAKKAEGAFSGMAGAMEGAIRSFVKNGKVDFRSFGDAVINTLIDIQMQSLKTNVLAPMMQSGMSWLGGLFGGGALPAGAAAAPTAALGTGTSLGFASILHDGGVVGRDGGSRQVPMGLFSGAKRFHSGGWPGLADDEVPAILQKGERVLSRGEVASGNRTEVVINNYGSDRASARESVDSRGNRRVEVIIGEAVAGEMRRAGSAAHSAVRGTFGVQPALVGR